MDKLGRKAKDLIAECHELGHPACIVIANNGTGRSIRAMDGRGDDVALMIAILIVEFAERINMSVEDVVEGLEGMAQQLYEDDGAKNKK